VGAGRFHIMRLLSFVEGQILSDIKITKQILFDLGVYDAQLIEHLEVIYCKFRLAMIKEV